MVQRAYEGGYGNPLIPNTDQILAINPSTLMRFFKQQYIGPHMVLAAAGVDHQALVHLARPMLAVLPTGGMQASLRR